MKREWDIPTALDPAGKEDFSEVYECLNEVTTIVMRLGGVMAVAPHRVEVSEGRYVTDRVLIKYDSYAPGFNQPQPQPEVEVADNGNADKATVAEEG